MYFDPRPKKNREDFYDREKELKEFDKALKSSPMVVITGIRRLGKTSLILVGLENVPSVLIDMRGVPQSREGIYRRVEASLNEFFRKNGSIWREVKRGLRRITGVQVLGSGISLAWGEKRADLTELFGSLKNHGVVVVFDEVQYARGPLGKKLAETLAYLYDYTDLRLVLSGSEVGLLYDFLGTDDPNAPLYGRYFREIKLERFDESKSIGFLRKGFEQAGLRVDEDILKLAYEKLDGIVGWLVHFGLKFIETGNKEEVIEEVVEEASNLVLEELNNFLEKHKPAEKRFFEVLRAVAIGKSSWQEIKGYMESIERRSIPDASLGRVLRGLLRASFLEKVVEGRNIRYKIPDPILEHVVAKAK